jgi:4-amino-4-deoxy-L-arabinose transferase-like glycosyltransferase
MSLTRRAGLVFLCAFAYLGWLADSRFVLTLNDEGIYLDGGLRVLHGQVPYRDFFSLTGPGTFALEAASMRVLGTTLAAGRLPVVFDIAILTACLFWLTSKLSNSLTAALACFTFLAFVTLGETAVVANHRWDSSAWAVLAATLIIAAVDSKRSSVLTFAAGLFVGIAAWCTPPVALVVVALGASLVAYRATRPLFVAYTGGVAVTLAAGLLWIVSTGALPAMLDSLLWSASNYSRANRVWYGSVTGGYASLLHGGSLVNTASALAVLVFFTLPATLPFLSAIWLWKRPSMTVVTLLVTGFALILSTYPRWDLNHLTWVSAPCYALAAALIARTSFKKAAAVIVLIAASSCFMVSIQQRLHETARVTSIGNIHGKQADLDVLTMIQARVKPSDALFVFPYRPLLYFVTGARNPTRYSFLQPGMFSDRDEAAALNELRSHPPRWVFYTHVPPEAYLRIWPGSDPQRLQMAGIETFLQENYQETEQWADFKLLVFTDARDSGQTALHRTTSGSE